MDDLRIMAGLPKGLERQAAALYWQAFGGKLGKLLGPAERGIGFFAETINHDAMLAAMKGEELLGIAAFKTGAEGFSSAGLRQLWQHYGFGTLWRLVPLALLERSPPEGILQMDGIGVSPAARGQGVGSALFEALFTLARQRGYRGVTLDVIDRNTRARALYERLGFEAQAVLQTGPLRALVGFGEATRMEKRLS